MQTTAQILDGRRASAEIYERLTDDVKQFAEETGRPPTLATVLVGDDPASRTYVRMKANRCRDIGIVPDVIHMPATSTTEEVVSTVSALSVNDNVDGILVQHPAPDHVDESQVFEAIDPRKDVDGVTGLSLAAMAQGEEGFASATPGGIMRLLQMHDIPLEGKDVVVVGRSRILGLPMGLLLLAQNATVTYCHSRTVDLKDKVSSADIVVAAAGRPGLIHGEWIKEGAVVVDAGYADNRGDVEFESAAQHAGYITPVPGGVGPMTIACLLEQTVIAARRSQGLEDHASDNETTMNRQ